MSFLLNFISGTKLKYSNELSIISEKEALDSLIYGINCNRIKLGEKSFGVLCLSDKIPNEISFLDRTNNKINNFKIKYITNITFNKTSENLKKYTKQNSDNNINNIDKDMCYMQISINQKTYDFEFENKNALFLFIKGFLIYLESDNFLVNSNKKEMGDYVEDNIEMLFEKNNENFDDLLDKKEFQNLAKEIGMDAKELLLYIDKNKDGIITKEEVITYFTSILKGLEFKELFEKYASIKNINDGVYTMNPAELKLFFHEEQKEFINDLESHQLIILFKSHLEKDMKRKMCKKFQNIFFYNKYQINKDEIEKSMEKLNNQLETNKELNEEITLELNLKEFSNMLNSFLLSVYDNKKQNSELDTSHSLVDYYINSSHNTYLKGHQLKGLSDPKMYSFAILAGYRLVELDCYNGENDDIIITHGFTLVTKLKLEDVLIEIRENAFKNSPYPVILSIENHLDEKHQQIMAKNLQKYLIDLYIFPNDAPPETIPTLEELKYKFIIKCGGKRLYEDIDIPFKSIDEENIKLRGTKNFMKKILIEDNFEDVSDSEEDIETENIDEFNENELNNIIVNRQKLSVNEDNKDNISKNNDLFIQNLDIKEEINLNLNEDSFNENDNNNDGEKDKIVLRAKPKKFKKEDSSEIKKSNEIEENKINSTEEINQLTNVNTQEFEKVETECIESLANIRGLIGQKFKYEKIQTFNYKPWEFVTLKSTLFMQISKNIEKRKELLKLSFHCMLKSYPQNFDSSNYDIIKCWSCGCQCAAINIQAVDDDFTLYNQIFFTQNQNCGYILKPNKFLEKNFIFEEYKIPKYNIKLEIINLFNFPELLNSSNIPFVKNAKMQMKIYSLDMGIGDKSEEEKIFKNEYIFDLKGGLLTPHIIDNKEIQIPVYEEELGGIMIKFFYEKGMIGRGCIPFSLMKFGYRKIPIYFNNCMESERVFVVGYFEKSFS